MVKTVPECNTLKELQDLILYTSATQGDIIRVSRDALVRAQELKLLELSTSTHLDEDGEAILPHLIAWLNDYVVAHAFSDSDFFREWTAFVGKLRVAVPETVSVEEKGE